MGVIKDFLKDLIKNKVLALMLLPALACLIIFNYMPMFGLILAFKKYNFKDGIFGSPWSGWENFKYLFKQDAFIITRNTIGYNLTFIFLGLIFAVFFAIALSELKNRFMAKVYQATIFLPYFLSWVVVSYLAYAFLSPDKGLLNNVFQSLGTEPVNWYSKPELWPFILTFINLWKGLGFGIVLYLAGILGIDNELYEAAVLDGASKLKQIRHITLPLLVPLMMVNTLLSLGRIFYSDFGLFYQVPRQAVNGILYPTTQVIDTYIINGLRTMSDIGMTAAATFYQSIVGFAVILVANTIAKKINPDNALF